MYGLYIASVRSVEAETGLPVVLIVFDSFAKLIAANGCPDRLDTPQVARCLRGRGSLNGRTD